MNNTILMETNHKIEKGQLIKSVKNGRAAPYKRKSKKTFHLGIAVNDSKYDKICERHLVEVELDKTCFGE